MALGAQRGNIARLVLGSGAKIAVTGCALGILGSLSVSHLVGAFLFGVSATNPIVYVASVLLMLVLALVPSARNLVHRLERLGYSVTLTLQQVAAQPG